jgi:hypothetical protein
MVCHSFSLFLKLRCLPPKILDCLIVARLSNDTRIVGNNLKMVACGRQFFFIRFVVVSSFTEIHRSMPRGVLKENLPTKICIICERPFTWRKKWERVWDEVTTCSKSCNRKRKARNRCDYGERQCSDSDSTDDKVVLAGDSLASVGSVTNMSIATDLDVEFPQREIVTEEEWNIQNEQSDISNENENGRDDDNGDDDGKFQLCNLSNDNSSIAPILDSFEAKALRRAEKKRKKAERRAQKMGLGDPTAGQKMCMLCSNSVNLLIRCTYDASGVWVSV